jgi:thiamine pyrophosphokinase
MDHEMAHMHALYQCEDHDDRVVMLGDQTAAFLLVPGVSNVIEHVYGSIEAGSCGLLPFVAVDSVTTRGLMWDVTAQPMSFAAGSLVSTSNKIAHPDGPVSIETSHPIVWVTGLNTSSTTSCSPRVKDDAS